MYVHPNFASKAALKRALAAGDEVLLVATSAFDDTSKEGKVHLEGPHYPQPHRWYAEAQAKDGKIVRVLS